ELVCLCKRCLIDTQRECDCNLVSLFQVFIGFVLKQFEYIEVGQFRDSEAIVPNIFFFLVLLSYERYHSKQIISIPKIIQLCDGIMASGRKAVTHGRNTHRAYTLTTCPCCVIE
uniref:Uncharacterized protein n=1 Tax=Hucho hucho TaxID=62062 RepID=A0A4W5LMG9_9TELE